MASRTWAILTGEYPPMPGGVADHTQQVARGLAQRGDEVHVWAPAECACPSDDGGVRAHRLIDHFAMRGLRQLEEEIAPLPKHARILVEYVPHAFGMKAMNVPFCAAVQRLGEQRKVDVMFHEVAMPMGRRLPVRWNMIGAANRLMARMLVRAADRVLVSTSAWCSTLQPMCRRGQAIVLAPIPSNITPCGDRKLIESIRGEAMIVGHFGSCHPLVRDAMVRSIEAILTEAPETKMMFIGGASGVAGEWIRERLPSLAPRIIVTGPLDADAVAAHIAACAVMLIPSPDGVTTRRSSAMAALASGVALVSCTGANTEAFWNDQSGVTLVPMEAESLAAAVVALLRNSAARSACAAAGRDLYESQFSLSRTLDLLMEC